MRSCTLLARPYLLASLVILAAAVEKHAAVHQHASKKNNLMRRENKAIARNLGETVVEHREWQTKDTNLGETYIDHQKGTVLKFWGHNVRFLDEPAENKTQPAQNKSQSVQSKTDMKRVRKTLDPPSNLRPKVVADQYLDFPVPRDHSFSQWKQDKILMPILDKLDPGFFVESGASDGQHNSNTLFLELNRGWSGLLVEPDPALYEKLRAKKRNCFSYNGALSPTIKEEFLIFEGIDTHNESAELSHVQGMAHLSGYESKLPVQTFTVHAQPLVSLLKTIQEHPTVDFWSLDVEGTEALVLKSTNFKQVEVGIMMIEMSNDPKNNEGILEVMNKEGFLKLGHTMIPDKNHTILDHIYVNPDYFKKRNLDIPTPQDLPQENRDEILVIRH